MKLLFEIHNKNVILIFEAESDKPKRKAAKLR